MNFKSIRSAFFLKMRNFLSIMGLPLIMLQMVPFSSAASGTTSVGNHTLESAQQSPVSIRGTITDPSGEPIIGANIVVKGTTTGMISDFDGNFTLDVPSNATLVISYIGYITQEISVGSTRNFKITLQEDAIALGEAVVIGYGTMERKQVTSSITSIKGDDLLKGTGANSVASALVGKITGLTLYENSSMGSTPSIQLRGMSSVNASQEPLIVIDGMPGGELRSVLPEDIASIDILKDASAGAIYGTRAAGGVILITTKSGSSAGDGKVRFSYTGEAIAKQISNKPEMLSAEEYVAHNRGTDYGSRVNWFDESTQSKISQRHIFTVEGGSKNAQVYASMSYENLYGIKKFDESTRYSGRINANFKLLDGWFEIKTHADYRQNAKNQSVPSLEQGLRNNPTRSPYDPNSHTGYNVWLNETLDYNTIANAALQTNDGLDKWFKPDVTLKLNVLAVPGLSVQQTLAYDNRQWEEHIFDSRYRKNQLEEGRTGYAKLLFQKEEYLTSEGYASYVNSFNDHSINATAGYSYWEKNKEMFEMENWNFTSDPVKFWNMQEGKFLKTGEAKMKSEKNITERLAAFFGRVNYSYKDTYMVTATMRHEGSSKFAEKNRWGTFWSLSGGWRFSNESFLRDVEWINDMKLRVGYGVTGNNGFDADYAATLYGSDQLWLLPGGTWANAYGKSKNVNPDLKWEERKEWNFGLDFSLFNNRVYGKFDVFRKTTDNMIYEVQVPQPPYTQETMHKNIGSMSNNGWEFEIGAHVVQTKDWNYTTNLGLSHVTTKIETLWGNESYFDEGGFLAPGNPGDAFRYQEGTTIGQFYLWKFAGFDEQGGWLLYNEAGEVIPATQKKYEDKQYVGNYSPKLQINWNHSLSYKNWDMTMTLMSWLDFDIYNSIDMYFGLPNTGDNLNVLKRAYTKYGHITGEKELCDYFLQDGSFLKIQNINIGYRFDARKYTRFLDNIRVYMSINDVYTFTKYNSSDPSSIKNVGYEGGIDWHTSEDTHRNFEPQARAYTVGLQVTF